MKSIEERAKESGQKPFAAEEDKLLPNKGVLSAYQRRRKVMRGRWTDEEVEVLTEMYPDHFAQEIAEALGKTASQVYNKAGAMGLRSSADKIRRSGMMSSNHPNVIASRFQKGNVPFNKGRKMSPEQYARCSATMFKKGGTPSNHREVGSERVNVDGYIEVKVAEPNKWRPKHRVVWEQHHGAIPRGCNVQFKDHNPLHCTIDNLYLISRTDQMAKENSFYARYPKELQEIIHLKGVVNRAIHKAERNGK